MLFTGMRKGEVSKMLWKNVDFTDRSFLIEDPKNGKDHLLPMSSFLYALLWHRKSSAKSDWVFPSKDGTGPMCSATGVYERISLKSGIKFSPHDLRRTFVNIARTVKCDHYTIKQFLNHSGGNDVTFACYTIHDIEILREPIERIAYALKMYLGIQSYESTHKVRYISVLPRVETLPMLEVSQ
jgi:integrase